MRLSTCSLAPLVAVILLTACQSAPPAAPEPASVQAPPPAPPPAVSAPASPMLATPGAVKTEPAQPAHQRPQPKPAAKDQDIAQLDLDNEGGVKDGSYAMWVHVTEGGKSVTNLPVLAFNTSNKLAAAARTNEDGDAMLKVQATTYRISATRGPWHAEQTVIYHPGSQFELLLRR